MPSIPSIPLHFYSNNHCHCNCLSPVLKHHYHQGPKALEHGPRWFLSSSQFLEHNWCKTCQAYQAYHSTFTPTIIAIATVSVPSWNTITIKARKLWNTDQGDFCHPLSSLSTTGARHAKHTKHTTPLLLQQSLPLQLSQSRLETPLPSRPESSGTRTKVIFVILSVPWAQLVQDMPSIPSIPLHFYSNNHCHCNCLSPVLKHHYHQGPKALEHGPRWFLSSSQFLEHNWCKTCQAYRAYHSTFTPTINAIATVSVPSWNTITIKARKLWNTDQGDFCHPLSSFSTTGARHAKHTEHTTPLLLQQSLPLQLSQSRLETPLPSRPESSGTRTKVIFVILSVPWAQLVQDMPSIPSIPLHFYSNNQCHCNCLSPVLKHHYHQGPKALEHGPRWFLSSSQFLEHNWCKTCQAYQAYHSTFTPTIIAIATVSVPSWNTITIKARKLWNTDQGDFCHPLSSFSTTGARHAKQIRHKQMTNSGMSVLNLAVEEWWTWYWEQNWFKTFLTPRIFEFLQQTYNFTFHGHTQGYGPS